MLWYVFYHSPGGSRGQHCTSIFPDITQVWSCNVYNTPLHFCPPVQSWQWLTFCDPWPIIQLTRSRMTSDPRPSPRPWHESITTTQVSWWVHDYCLLFSSMMCNLEFWIWLIQWIFYSIYSKSSSLHSTRQCLQAEHGEQIFIFLNLTSYTFTLHV